MVTEVAKIATQKQIELEKIHDNLRKNFSCYTKRAYKTIPSIYKPSILDIGCGTGIPTLDLVNMSNGHVTAIDIDDSKLRRLVQRVKDAGVSERVDVIRCSMLELEFPDSSFDIIWAEGTIAIIGFEKGIKEWRRLLKPNGFLAIHDMREDLELKKQQVENNGYLLLEHFSIPGEKWWSGYYEPLGRSIEQLLREQVEDQVLMARISRDRIEIEKVKNNPSAFDSEFLVLQKQSGL